MKTRLIHRIILGLSLTALLAVSCDRKIESKDPVRSLPDRLPAPINLTHSVGDREITLNWEMTDTSGVARYRIYAAVGDEGAFQRHDSSSSRTAVVSDLPYNQAVRFRVTAVNSDGAESEPSDVVSALIGLLSVAIEEDNVYTNDRSVQIALTVPGTAAYVLLSEDSLFAGVSPRVFTSPTSFRLSQGDGIKRVYAGIIFEDGSESTGRLYDEIILDTYAAIDSVYLSPTGETFSAGETISFYLEAGGEIGGEALVSFPGTAPVNLVDDGSHGDTSKDDGLYSFDYTVPIGLTVAGGTLTGNFTDAAGNQAVQATGSEEVNIQTGSVPDSVTLAVGLTDGTTARLSWTRSDESDFESYRVYRDATSPVTLSDDLITIITDVNTLTHDDYLPQAGIYYYRVYVFDQQGQYSGSNEAVISR